jgi:hypothetical protein
VKDEDLNKYVRFDHAAAQLPVQTSITAPLKQLPTWTECEVACDDLTATPLQRFIYNYEPGNNDSEWRNQLMKVLTTTRADAVGEAIEAVTTHFDGLLSKQINRDELVAVLEQLKTGDYKQ